jgi:hypothetical protein
VRSYFRLRWHRSWRSSRRGRLHSPRRL